MRGRKPLPSHLKLVTGNRGKRPIKPENIEFKISLPMPPPHLCDDAKVEWGRVAPMLYALRLLSEADVASLAAYCDAYATWKQATTALNKMAEIDKQTSGLMIKTSLGNVIQNPLRGIANTAASNMVKFASDFGMNPVARARIHSGDPKDKPKDQKESYFGT